MALGAALALAMPLAACSADPSGSTTVTVLAASSLTGTFTELADEFEAAHPGVRVRLAFGSSATLAQQALDGAPGDVLATADLLSMESAAAAVSGERQIFATNSMVLVTPAANPAGITGIADLERDGLTFVTCVPTAPCGKVADALLADNAVTASPVSREIDVKAVLARVTSDEVDAGIVYATDARAAGTAVTTWPIPRSDDEITSYPIATLRQASRPDLAQEFLDLVLSSAGRDVLGAAGFGQP